MIDVSFYMATHAFKKQVMAGKQSEDGVYEYLEAHRSRIPVVNNIETTNACNLTCPFCPRTTLMTRPVKTMAKETFIKVINQLNPHPAELWQKWVQFAEKNYGVPQDEMSENNFFLYILPKVIVLHGYGDPLLDPHIPEYVGLMRERGLLSYFSCNPVNIQLEKTQRAFENGLTYIKYSIDSLSASERGLDSFAHDYPLVMKVLEMKAQKNLNTHIVITMIDLGRPNQAEEFQSLQDAFKGTGVYIYQKSLDQAWMLGTEAPKSIHWSEYCQIPMSSMTINSSGLAVTCQEDWNGDIVLGDVRTQSLYDIWNGAEYDKLRHVHIDATPGHRCIEKCDMKVIGKFLNK